MVVMFYGIVSGAVSVCFVFPFYMHMTKTLKTHQRRFGELFILKLIWKLLLAPLPHDCIILLYMYVNIIMVLYADDICK